MKKITNSEKETFDFAKNIAKKFKGGEVIGLIGDLGAGKTIFSKGLAAGLGIKKNITSPTFSLMKIYNIKKNKNIKILCHIDAYRLKTFKDLEAIGAEEYFYNPNAITIVEWADRVKKILPKNSKIITIKNKEENTRIVEIKKRG